jgi:HAD superfamily hydrolase (TIGR01509 family)
VSRFDLIVFDMDGVLTDSSAGHARAYSDLWSRLGISGPSYSAIMGRATAEAIAEQTRHLDPTAEQIAEWTRFKQERAREYLADGPVTFPDTIEVLEALAAGGFALAVGTSASRDTAHLLLERAGILPLVRTVVTRDDVRHGKPAPDTFVLAVTRSGDDPRRTLVVEDSLAGLEAADAAGAWSAAVRTKCEFSGERFLGNYPDLRALLPALGMETA